MRAAHIWEMNCILNWSSHWFIQSLTSAICGSTHAGHCIPRSTACVLNICLSLSKLKLLAPRRAFASLLISPEHKSWGKQSPDHPSSENSHGWAAFFRGLSDINHFHRRYRKDLFKSSELCCRTCCCLLLGALSQWIGLCLGEQMNTGFFFFCFRKWTWKKKKSRMKSF